MKAKDCKITVSGVETDGIGSWSFDTFESEEERNKFKKKAEDAYKYYDRQPYKKYILFEFDYYEPLGGVNDIACSFDTVNEAIEYIFLAKKNKKYASDVYEVVDRDTWQKVAER